MHFIITLLVMCTNVIKEVFYLDLGQVVVHGGLGFGPWENPDHLGQG